ncbi:hypothetical protein LZ496_00955 [Sphingomonas sp. NSE70-1]|uniref:Tetratricopeptide repeat-containing protein n=1 Tax=Sphingomonas caseinilyticus TaxID=2908205 RepID=A0ABT0RQX3_9SPHN|nr:hypothetical protein [Sphingomonas caseinilyticus]MCL6697361.1 hypothetical protein [Sphingomonas caseinilyticus]
MAWGRTALALAVALSLAILIVLVALSQSYSGGNAAKLSRFWPGHPDAVLQSGLAEIGAKAAAAEPIDPALIDHLLDASAKAPLAPEPFLVRGVEAQLAGDEQLALRAFIAARERSPRTIAARYFLADHYLKAGQTGQGLAEISTLARLVPQSIPDMAPFLAAFARSPGAAPQVRQVLRTHPQLEPVLLDALSTDPENVDLILGLWNGQGGEQDAIWQRRLLNHLVDAGRFQMARETWARFAGVVAEPSRLFDPEFGKPAPPPFGWSLASGPAGVAESEGDGRLHALFYGRDDAVLATQLLVLEPGRYRLSMKAEATAPSSSSLEWTVKCLPSLDPVAVIPLIRSGSISQSFSVPTTGCPAQRLELNGTAQQMPQQADVTISQFNLQPEVAR